MKKLRNINLISYEIKTTIERSTYTIVYHGPHIFDQEICGQANEMLEDGMGVQTTLPITTHHSMFLRRLITWKY